MRILHTSDWHLGKNVNNYSMLEDQKYILNQIKEICISHQVDVIIISGDIYDRAVPSYEAMRVLEDFLYEMINVHHKKIVMITGNHDNERLGFGSKLFEKSELYIASSITDIMIDGVRFYLIPYFNLYQFRDMFKMNFSNTEEAYKYIISNVNLNKETYNILVAHDYVTFNHEVIKDEVSESIGGAEFVDASIFEEFNYVALGHLHGNHRIMKDHIRYSGSILKYSFSEVNQKKSVTIIDTYNTFYHVDLKPRRDMVIIKGLLEELIDPSFYSQYDYENDYFKAVILDKGEVIDAFSKLKAIYPNLMEIYKESLNINLNNLKRDMLEKSKTDLFKDFYLDVTGTYLEEDELAIIKENLKEESR